MKNLTNDKKIHFIYFLTKIILIGIVFFFGIELIASKFINNISPEYSNDFLSHIYCGTFFIEISKSANFISENAYNTFVSLTKTPAMLSYFSTLLIIITIVLIFIVLKRADKNKLLHTNSSNLIIGLGCLYLINNLLAETNFFDIQYLNEYATGFLKTATYYPQVYHIFIIPAVIISYGLILKIYDNRNNPRYLSIFAKLTKLMIALIIIISGLFIAYRFSSRLSELIFINANKNMNIKIPFINYLIELPQNLAINQASYAKLVTFRFIKDIPIFITSLISIVLFINVLYKSIKGKINTQSNLKKLNIIIALLILSSLYFNIMGSYEINILHQNFLSPFKEATYTLAIRSYTDPIIYALIIYIFKVFIQIFPKEK